MASRMMEVGCVERPRLVMEPSSGRYFLRCAFIGPLPGKDLLQKLQPIAMTLAGGCGWGGN